MRNSRGLTFFLVLLTAVFLPAQERIEWEPVAGADHYLVEIRQNGALVFKTRSEEPFLPLFLPPGRYDFQIGVVDTFGNVKFTDEPSHLKISAPLIPFIVDVSPRTIRKGAKPMFTARVSGLLENEEQSTVFVLESAEGKRLQLDWETSGSAAEGWIKIALSAGKMLSKAGAWHLIMTNPDGREDRFESALSVDPHLQIRSMNPRKFAAGNPAAVLRLKAKGFSGEANLIIEGPSAIPIAKLNQGEKGVFEFSLNLSDASEGQYSVSLINPPEEIDTGIHPPKTASFREALEIEKESQPISEFPNAVYGGWKPIIRINGADIDTDMYSMPQLEEQPFFAGFSLGYSRSIKNVSQKTPYLDGLEWYLSANYVQNRRTVDTVVIKPLAGNFVGVTERATEVYHSLAFLLGISYITWFDFPLNLLAMAGLGVDFAFHRYSDKIPSLPASFFEEVFPPKNSARFVMSFDLGVRWDITPRLFVNMTANTMAKSAISGNNEWSIQPRVEGGWRW